MNIRVAILGANGQLGTDLTDVLSRTPGIETIPLTHQDIEITDFASVKTVLTQVQPHVILNTVAFHDVPRCEQEADRAYQVNALGALHVARVAESLHAWNIYFSTDYVFSGTKQAPYVEEDLPQPLNVYGTTKLAGEMHTLTYCQRGIVLRISGIYGRVPSRVKGTNFVYTMLQKARNEQVLRVVADEWLTPTWTYAIAHQVARFLRDLTPGIFHCTCQGACSWYTFAQAIFDLMGKPVQVIPISAQDYPSGVRRPPYSVLANQHFAQLGIDQMPHWYEALENFLKILKET